MNSTPSKVERLQELRRKILEKTNKSDAVLNELKELNKNISLFEKIFLSSSEAKELQSNIELLKSFGELNIKLSALLENYKDLRISNLNEIPKPQVIFPRTIKVENLDQLDKEIQKVEVTNQSKIDFLSPIKFLSKSVEDFFQPYILRIMTYISEPNRIVITDENITEYYGERKVTYTRKQSGKTREIIRNET